MLFQAEVSSKTKIAVVGVGYIGAVLSAFIADRGSLVKAIDINPKTIDAYQQGHSLLMSLVSIPFRSN